MPETKINGARFYEEHGEGFPLVFTHGLGADRTMWTFQTPVFKGKYRGVTWDIRGHGRSEVTPVPTQEAWQQEIPGSKLKIIPGAGHVPPMENPELWNRLVTEFLENMPA
jgi:pimeloyl-ACP methyl ester carboxylesterase